jgi:hypothetical protein
MNIDFCNSKAYLVENDKLRESVMKECDSLLGLTLKRDYFPGPQPVAVEKKDFPTLEKNKYMVCEKTDGERAVLMMLYVTGKPMCFIVNRNNQFHFIDISFKKEVYEGTIFDGELVKTNKGVWHYLIHDCMCYNGTSFIEKSHRLRYACIIDCIVKRYNHKENDCFLIKTKLFYNYGPELEKTWEHIKKTTENKIDGLIFTPIDGPIKFGRDTSLFKWKEPGNNTIDLVVKTVGKKINLYYLKKTLVIYKSFTEKDDNYKILHDFLNETKENGTNGINEVIVEFKYTIEDNLFIPYRIRSDKNKPNGEITVLNTIKNIEEAIVIEDF